MRSTGEPEPGSTAESDESAEGDFSALTLLEGFWGDPDSEPTETSEGGDGARAAPDPTPASATGETGPGNGGGKPNEPPPDEGSAEPSLVGRSLGWPPTSPTKFAAADGGGEGWSTTARAWDTRAPTLPTATLSGRRFRTTASARLRAASLACGSAPWDRAAATSGCWSSASTCWSADQPSMHGSSGESVEGRAAALTSPTS